MSSPPPQMRLEGPTRSLPGVAILAPALILALSGVIEAATFNALSPDLAYVAAAVSSAADGDTVIIPAGTATWMEGLIIDKAITLQGKGISITVIEDGVQSGRLIDWTLVAGKLSSSWDVNHIGAPFYSGTTSGGSSGLPSALTVAGSGTLIGNQVSGRVAT